MLTVSILMSTLGMPRWRPTSPKSTDAVADSGTVSSAGPLNAVTPSAMSRPVSGYCRSPLSEHGYQGLDVIAESEQHPGTGLGLRLSDAVVRLHIDEYRHRYDPRTSVPPLFDAGLDRHGSVPPHFQGSIVNGRFFTVVFEAEPLVTLDPVPVGHVRDDQPGEALQEGHGVWGGFAGRHLWVEHHMSGSVGCLELGVNLGLGHGQGSLFLGDHFGHFHYVRPFLVFD